jgi:hypothetical protein
MLANQDVRLKEHCKPINPLELGVVRCSTVGEHSWNIHGCQPDLANWDVEILCVDQYRKALEAREIRKLRPTLNRDSGVYILAESARF